MPPGRTKKDGAPLREGLQLSLKPADRQDVAGMGQRTGRAVIPALTREITRPSAQKVAIRRKYSPATGEAAPPPRREFGRLGEQLRYS